MLLECQSESGGRRWGECPRCRCVDPSSLMLINEVSEGLIDSFVCLFAGTISLWMVGSQEFESHAGELV